MSLTGLLKSNSELGKEFRDIISIVDIDTSTLLNFTERDILVRYNLKDHSLASQLGTALDYMFRFVLMHKQSKLGSTNIDLDFVAKYGLSILLSDTSNGNNNYEKIYQDGLEIIESFAKGNYNEKLFNRVIGVSVYFAKLEQIYRSGYATSIENDLKYKINPYVEAEIKNQVKLFGKSFDEKFSINSKITDIYYNPSFGRCSLAVGGADADVIIGTTLIDFKSSKYLKNIEEDFKQLVGYLLFNNLVNNNKVDTICLYYSRFGKFIEYKFTEKDKKNISKSMNKMNIFIDNIMNRKL